MPSKRYNKDRTSCTVTFALPKARAAGSAFVVGDFNDWNEASHPMAAGRSGRLELALKLAAPRRYAYRLLVDGAWENDPTADGATPNPYGSEDSTLDL